MITYKLKIDCNEPRHLISDMEFVAGDVGAYRLECSFYNGKSRMDISDKLCTIKGKRADGVVISDSGEIKENKACFTLKNSIYSVPGELMMEIALSDRTENYITTVILSAKVLNGLGTPDAVAENDVSVYVTLLAQTTDKLNQAEQLLTTTRAFVEETETNITENAEIAKKAVEDVADFAETVSQNLIATEEAKQLAASYSESAGAHHAETERLAEDVLENKESVSTLHAETERLAREVLENKISADKSREAAEYAAAEAKEAIEYKADKNDASNALKGSASGETVRVDDVSPMEHQVNVNVRSKNLIDYNGFPESVVDYNGLTFTRVGDEITINGTATKSVDLAPCYLNIKGEIGKSYTLSVEYISGTITTGTFQPHVGIGSTAGSGKGLRLVSLNIMQNVATEPVAKSATLTLPFIKAVWFYTPAGVTLDNYKFKLQLEEGDTATEYKPYVDPTTVTVTRYGKNILDVKNAPIAHTNPNTPLYTWERTETGFKIQYVTERNDNYSTHGYILGTTEALKGKTITVSSKAVLNPDGIVTTAVTLTPKSSGYVGASGTNKLVDNGGSYVTVTIPMDADAETYPYVMVCFYIGRGSNNPVDSIVEYKDIQVEFSDTATEYEPYKASITYTPNADGVVENVTSIYPTTTFATNKLGAIIDCEYNKDANKVIEKLTNAIISLGGNV